MPSETTEESVWSVRDVTLNGRTGPRLEHVSLEIPPERVAVLGVSGAGKSSLLRILAGFETPDSGEVIHRQKDSPLPVYWAPQDYGLWPHLTVQEHLEVVRPSGATLTVSEWLGQFRLQSLSAVRPDELSEGERSRLSVLRALAAEADAVLLDEPLAHVDPVYRDADWKTVMTRAGQFCHTVVFATHDPAMVRGFADRVVCLDRGQVAFTGAIHELLYSPPNPETAWLLGPCNWLDGRLRNWLPDADRDWVCLRPEEIFLTTDPAGTATVTEIEDRGTVLGVHVRQQDGTESDRLYVTWNPGVLSGTRVRIDVVPSRDRM